MRSSRFSVSEKVSSSSSVRSRALALGHAEVAGVVVERLLDGEEPVEVELLRRQPDRLPRLAVVADRVVAEDLDRAAGRLRQPGRAVDQRRLAGPVGAEQAEELARLDLERDAAQRLHPGRVALDQILDMQGRLRHGDKPRGRPRSAVPGGRPTQRAARLSSRFITRMTSL